MTRNHESPINRFLEQFCELSLEILPFEGAAIALYDPDEKRLKASGAAGIFISEKMQEFVDSEISLKPSGQERWFMQDATQAFIERQGTVDNESLIENVSFPGSERALVANNVHDVEKKGFIKFNYELYKEGKQPLTAIALPLRRTEQPLVDEFLGLFVLNNPVLPTTSRDERIDRSIWLLVRLFTQWASSFLTKLSISKLENLRLPNSEEVLENWYTTPPISSTPQTTGIQMSVINWVESSRRSQEIFVGSMVTAVVLIGFLCFLMVSDNVSWWTRFYISFLVGILTYEMVLVGREFWRHWKEKK
jgi:hypothetical protein